ncbi:MAG TPA: hypothetical protein ENH10_01260, partial [Bacteroidetes bacterium]|nr:hypothetical protein [Bacteroidota bacterium]HEX03773.1 hypothetical protein [Bacteroidota bacterium]
AYRLKIPRVTGYLLMGLLIGPHLTGLIPEHVVKNLDVINDIALGLILFAIGNEFEWSLLKRIGIWNLIRLAAFESTGVMVLVSGGFLLLGYDLVLSLLIGSIAVATAPAATLLVVREYHSKGPLTDRLLALVAINNLLAMGLFRVIYSFVHLGNGADPASAMIQPIYEVVVSVVLGIALGKLLGLWEKHLDELPELLLVIIGIVLVGTGIARMLHLPPMLVAMAAGATVANSSYVHRLIYVQQRQLEQPIYIAFFVLAGLSLHLETLLKMGIAGIVYLVARLLGKIGGIWVAGKYSGQPKEVSNFLGITLLCQAGVAIGLSYEVLADYPEIGQMITTIVLATVILNETIGPYLIKLGLTLAKEIQSENKIKAS